MIHTMKDARCIAYREDGPPPVCRAPRSNEQTQMRPPRFLCCCWVDRWAAKSSGESDLPSAIQVRPRQADRSFSGNI